MAPLSVAQQDRLIRRDWPSFRTILLGRGVGLWRGVIFGLSRPYDVSILLVRNHHQDVYELGHAAFPEVRVHAPLLTRRPEAPDVPIPHVYDEGRAQRPPLCLFDPAEGGWDLGQSIASTTVPLAAQWLRFYEIWDATGIWTGGGRDHIAPTAFDCSASSAAPRLAMRTSAVTGLHSSRAVLGIGSAGTQFPIWHSDLYDRLDRRFDRFELPLYRSAEQALAA